MKLYKLYCDSDIIKYLKNITSDLDVKIINSGLSKSIYFNLDSNDYNLENGSIKLIAFSRIDNMPIFKISESDYNEITSVRKM